MKEAGRILLEAVEVAREERRKKRALKAKEEKDMIEPTTTFLSRLQAFKLAKKFIAEEDMEGFNKMFMVMTPQMLNTMLKSCDHDSSGHCWEEDCHVDEYNEAIYDLIECLWGEL